MSPRMHRSRSKEFTELVRHHLAIGAVTPSAARQMVPKGGIQYVRKFLDDLDIRRFNNPANFRRSLDLATKSLARWLPKGRWGAARKFLNIYLRNITYNVFLRRAYRLDRVESLLELPLDSFAAKGLHAEREGGALPGWKGVIHLTPESSAVYQAVAAQVAKRLSISRVHLDMRYWRAVPLGRKSK